MNSRIQLVQPRGVDDFWKSVDEDPDTVVAVTEVMGIDGKFDRFSVWSTFDKAMEYARESEYGCVICAHIIDDPNWGNRSTH